MSRTRRHCRFAFALALPWLAASCHDTTAPHPVAKLVVTGAPAGPLLVGSTVQIEAVPFDAQGDSLAGRVLTWSSSDVNVATVTPFGVVTGVGPGTATVRVSSGAQTDTIPFDFRVGAVLDPSGGRVALFGDTLTLTLPKEALARSTTLLARIIAPAADPRVVGVAYDLAPVSISFAKAVALSLRYDAGRIPTGVSQHRLLLGLWSGSVWTPVTASTVDTSSGIVTGAIARGGTYAVMWTTVARVAITAATHPESLYVGETVQLHAAPYDSLSDPLPPRTATWSSSSPSVATVDSTGLVSAAGVGAATITASIDGRTDTVSVAVLGGLVVDWSRAADWTGFQGGARHDGYVPVTMNPQRFHELWSVLPFGGIPPLAAVTADSSVIVTPVIGDGVARVAVFDVATGRQRWNYDFGPVTLDPPAYAGGSLFLQTVGPDSLRLWSFDARTSVIRFRTAYGASWISYLPPTIAGSAVYAASRLGIAALDTAHGATRWFASTTDDTSSYDTQHVPSPAVAGGMVYAWDGQSARGLTVLDTTGALQYTIPDSGFTNDGAIEGEAPALGGSNDVVVINGGRLISFDLVGRRIAWQLQDRFQLTPAIANGVLYVVNGNQVEARSETDGSLLWSYAPPDGAAVGYSCVVSDNILFVATYGSVFAVDLATHATVWSFPHNGALAVSRQGILFISSPYTAELIAISLR